MTLNQLKQVLDSLVELEPRIDGSWGPSIELANMRKTKALKILNRALTEKQNLAKIAATGDDNAK